MKIKRNVLTDLREIRMEFIGDFIAKIKRNVLTDLREIKMEFIGDLLDVDTKRRKVKVNTNYF